MENIKKYLPWTIRIIISFLFLLSAVAKLYPSPYFAISTFEVKQLYPLGFSEGFAPYFSRILIGIELALGLLLLQSHYLRRIVIPATILMLVVFTTHLSIETFVNGGNSGNCGCFGSLLPMTPIEAIVKNVVAIILLAYLLKLLGNTRKHKSNFWILTTVTFASILSLFMMAPIQPIPMAIGTEFSASEEPVNEIVEDTIVASPETPLSTSKIDTVTKIDDSKKVDVIVVDEPSKHKSGYASYFAKIDKGRKTLCFFVPGCEHCREVAKELTEMKKEDKNFPEISIIFMNEEAFLIPDFFKFAGAEYPYKIVEVIPFWKLLGTNKDTPGVKYLWNGNEYVYYYGITDNKFIAADFKNLVNKPYAELKK